MAEFQTLRIVNEVNRIVQWDVSPVVADEHTYRMQIREDPTSTTAPEVDFNCTTSGVVVTCTGDCSPLKENTKYRFDLEEDGRAIVAGQVLVIQKVTK